MDFDAKRRAPVTMKKSLRFSALMIIVLLATSSFAYADFSAYVTASSMDVYADSAGGKQVASLSKNTVVTVSSHSSGMAKITYKKKTGYAKSSDMASISENSEKAVVNTSTRVYKKASTKGNWSALKKGTTVNLLSTSGDWALIERSGRIGYTKASHLSTGGGASATETADNTDSNVVVENFTATVTASSLTVYKKDSNSSKKLGRLKKGASIEVRSYNDTWARVESKGVYGYCLRSGLSRNGGANDIAPGNDASAPSSENNSGSTAQTLEQTISSGKYSNEEVIFLFLTKNMGLNAAAACGILSNIRSESTFSPTAYNHGGGSYGICQWTGNRFTRLKTYCSDKGYDYTTMAAQLYFLKYELENHYTSTLSYIRKVDNSTSGAYDAGYYWCYNYEVPANRSSVSVKRGNYARDTYWEKYGG